MSELPNRRPCVTSDMGMGISVTVSYHPESNQPVEVFLSSRGKASDNDMQNVLYNLGVEASSLMHKENPFTKEDVEKLNGRSK